MSDTYQWVAEIAEEQNVIATIQSGTWYIGPFSPGEIVLLAKVIVRNDGTTTGKLNGQSFFYPGQPNEQSNTKSGVFDIPPGGTWEYAPVAHIPGDASGILPVGVKVWGETETEPAWALFNLKIPRR